MTFYEIMHVKQFFNYFEKYEFAKSSQFHYEIDKHKCYLCLSQDVLYKIENLLN